MQKIHKAFYEHVDLHQYRSILALNGELPDKSFFDVGLPVIAADGAANRLYEIGVRPKVIVGDLDSADPKILEEIESEYVLDQNKCDFEKALEYANQHDLSPSIIVGASGGYIDHILNNLRILIASKGVFYSPPIVGHILNHSTCKTFYLKINTKISLIGATEAVVSSHGLKWELDKAKLFFAGNNSCFNRIAMDEISIEVHSGTCSVMIYLQKMHDAGGENN